MHTQSENQCAKVDIGFVIRKPMTVDSKITLFSIMQVYGWGRGEHGRLGFGDNDKSSKMVPQKVQLLAGEDIVQVLLSVSPLCKSSC